MHFDINDRKLVAEYPCAVSKEEGLDAYSIANNISIMVLFFFSTQFFS